MKTKKIQVIIEKSDDELLWGRIEGRKSYLPTTYGSSTSEVLDNLRMLIEDYQQHEKDGDKFWLDLNLDNINFEIVYDLQSFFIEHDFLNISAIARHAGLNESLLRQYATGKKFPSLEQTQKIELTIKQLVKQLDKVSLYAVA